MKKIKTKKYIREAASLFIATLLIITSVVVTASTSEKNDMQTQRLDGYSVEIQDTSVEPGTTDKFVEVTGSWEEEIFAIYIKVEYGPTLGNGDITITNVSYEGCVDEVPANDALLINNEANTGSILLYVQFDSWPYTPGQGIPAGSGKLFNIVIDVAETAEDQDVDFVESDSANVWYALYENFQIEPDVIPGVITILSPFFNVEIQDTIVEPGTTENIIEVSGSWTEEIFGIMIRINYGEALSNGDITITNITLDGCINENPVSYVKQINNDGTSGDVLILMQYDEYPYTQGQGIPAGSGRLFNIIVEIAQYAHDQEIDFTGGDTAIYWTYPNEQQDIEVIPGTLTIFKPLPELSISSINGGRGINATIENIGDSEATNIEWEINIQNGLIMLTTNEAGTIPTLEPGESEIITMSVLGIGLGIITPLPKFTINAECDQGVATNSSIEAKIFLSNVII